METDIEKIEAIVDETGRRYPSRAGDLQFAGVEGSTDSAIRLLLA